MGFVGGLVFSPWQPERAGKGSSLRGPEAEAAACRSFCRWRHLKSMRVGCGEDSEKPGGPCRDRAALDPERRAAAGVGGCGALHSTVTKRLEAGPSVPRLPHRRALGPLGLDSKMKAFLRESPGRC